MTSASEKWIPRQHPFKGAWLPNADPSLIGPDNYQTLQNMRYSADGLTIVKGYSKVNTTALTTYTKIRNGFQLRVDRAVSSYDLVQAYDVSGNSKIYQNQTAVPSQGDFEATALHTDASGAGLGRFCGGPGGVVYANEVETMGWWGEEWRAAGFFVVSDVIVSGNDIALNDNGASPDTIVSGSTSFLDMGFRIGQTITVSGANTAANDGDYVITDISSDGLTVSIATGSLAGTDAAGASTVTVEAASGVDYLNPVDYTEAVANALTTSGNLAVLGGGDDSYTKLLLHMNGTDESTTFTDDSISGHSPVASGNAQLDTAQQKFGTASGLFDGTGDYVSVPDSSDWNYGTTALTIDTWIRFASTSGIQVIYSQYDSTNGDVAALYFYNGSIYLVVSNTGALVFDEEVAWSPSINTWYHFALIRGWGGVADDWAITVNGTAIHTFTDAGTWPNHPDAITIGGMETDQDIDIGPSHHSIQFHGSANITTSVSKFGDGSYVLDGAADYITSPASSDWGITISAADNWTIELWAKHTDHAGTENYLVHWQSANDYWALRNIHGTGLRFQMDDAGVNELIMTAAEIDTTDWVHIAVIKVADEYGIYVNGTQTAYVQESNINSIDGALYIGVDGALNGYFDGNMDGVRIYHGNPYSAAPNNVPNDTITVPTSAHTPDANTHLLLQADTKTLNGWLDEYRISTKARWTSTFTVPTRAYQETQRRFYLFSTRPLQGFKAYISAANTEAATTLSGWEWTGKSFSTLSLTDGTTVGGITMAQTGAVTFSSTVSTAKPWHFEGLYLYAYLFEISDGGAEIYQVTVDAPWQNLVDVWDGIERTPVEVQMHDASASNWDDWTLSVIEESSNLYPIGAELVDGADLMTSSDHLVFGFEERTAAIRVVMIGGRGNTAAAKPTIYYWSGTDYVSVGTVVDTTATRETDHVTLSQTGLWSWYPPSAEDEAQQTLFGRTAYYYKVQFDANLAGAGDAPEVVIDLVTGIPAQYVIPPVAFPVEYKNQVFLFGHNQGNEGNRADFCAPGAVDVWNGELSSMGGLQSLYFGGPEEMVAAQQVYNRYGSNLIVGLLALKKTKAYMLTGDTPEDYKIYPVSQTLGCVAPLTLVSADAAYSVAENISRHVLIWLSHAGPVIFDGATLSLIKGIENFFDSVKSEYIKTSLISRSRGAYDPRTNLFHLAFPSGTSATDINKWLAYDLGRQKWYEIVPTTYPQAIWNVFDTDGIGYLFGGIDTGYVMRLENGTTWDGSGIAISVETGDFMPLDMFHTTMMRKLKVIAEKISEDVDLSVYHYGDTMSDDATVDLLVPLDSGSNRLTWTSGSLGSNAEETALFHRFKFNATFSTTSDWSLLGYGYQFVDKGLRD